MPVAAIRHAPQISSGRRSWRGAIQPMISVSSAVPSSDAVATIPTATGVVTERRHVGRQDDDGKTVAEAAQAARRRRAT